MQYLINLSEESDHFLRQLCDPRRNSEAVSVEDFLSAFVQEQLDELFLRHAQDRPLTIDEVRELLNKNK